jgi:hypothetical protein
VFDTDGDPCPKSGERDRSDGKIRLKPLQNVGTRSQREFIAWPAAALLAFLVYAIGLGIVAQNRIGHRESPSFVGIFSRVYHARGERIFLASADDVFSILHLRGDVKKPLAISQILKILVAQRGHTFSGGSCPYWIWPYENMVGGSAIWERLCPLQLCKGKTNNRSHHGIGGELPEILKYDRRGENVSGFEINIKSPMDFRWNKRGNIRSRIRVEDVVSYGSVLVDCNQGENEYEKGQPRENQGPEDGYFLPRKILGPIIFLAAVACLLIGCRGVYQRLDPIGKELNQFDYLFVCYYILALLGPAVCYLIGFFLLGHQPLPRLRLLGVRIQRGVAASPHTQDSGQDNRFVDAQGVFITNVQKKMSKQGGLSGHQLILLKLIDPFMRSPTEWHGSVNVNYCGQLPCIHAWRIGQPSFAVTEPNLSMQFGNDGNRSPHISKLVNDIDYASRSILQLLLSHHDVRGVGIQIGTFEQCERPFGEVNTFLCQASLLRRGDPQGSCKGRNNKRSECHESVAVPINKVSTASDVSVDHGAETGWVIVIGSGYFAVLILGYALIEGWRERVLESKRRGQDKKKNA